MSASLHSNERRRRPATGTFDDAAISPKISIRFDPEMFAAISARAQAAGRPFAVEVRALVSAALSPTDAPVEASHPGKLREAP